MLMALTISAGAVLLFCTVGVYTTENFARYGHISYESLWYEFPPNLKKYLPMIIANAQQPRIFRGLGIIDLNLMTFTKVDIHTFCWKFTWIRLIFFAGDENCCHLLFDVQKCVQMKRDKFTFKSIKPILLCKSQFMLVRNAPRHLCCLFWHFFASPFYRCSLLVVNLESITRAAPNYKLNYVSWVNWHGAPSQYSRIHS